MKQFVLFSYLLVLSIVMQAQNVQPAYQDGRVYVKCEKSSLKKYLAENPRNIPVIKISFLEELVLKYGIQKVSRPFFQANDDAVLPYILRIEISKQNLVDAFVQDLQKLASVEYAEKVPLAKIDAIPNDPLFLTPGGGNHLNQINAPNAWNISTGNPSITVAIIDNAVMWTHADLIANTYTNTGEIANNGIDDDGNGYVDDRNGFDVADYDNSAVPTNTNMSHGTHCAGIAAATTNNGIGIAGIGWNIKFIPVKCEVDNGSTSNVTYGFEGIIYATKAKAKVISMSWTNFSNVASTTEQSVINYAWNRGCIVIACAGNFASSTPYYPGAYNNVYCVAAVTNSDVAAPYSNYGTWVDIAAPGTTINSTVPYLGSAQYQPQSGTSMATPLVAGLAGLILSYAPDMTRTNVLNCISSSAANIYTLSGNSAYVSGNLLGAGRIDAYNALLCAASYTAHLPQANFYAFPRSSCPNTNIQFSDSSNYAPLAYNWVFQGGSPATSTLANPVVQWSTPGTFSVSLTVGNTTGTNSIVKQSYINISNPSSLNVPFQEGFEATAFLPAGWTPNNIMNDEIYWQRKSGLGAFGNSTACAMFDNSSFIFSGDRDEMRSPRFNFSNVSQVHLRFDVAYAKYDDTFSDSLEVKMSNNCGQTWSTIYYHGGSSFTTCPDYSNGTFLPSATQWRTDSVDVSTLAGQGAVMFSFINHGHFGQPIYLDNINLFFPSPALSVNFNSVVCASSPVQFSNTSSGASNYNWQFQAGTPSVSAITNPSVVFTNSGNYTLSLSGVNGPAQAVTTRTVNVVNAGNMVNSYSITNASCITCTDGAIQVLTNGPSSFYTFSWTPNVSNTASAGNLSQGQYTVQVGLSSVCTSGSVLTVSFPDGINAVESNGFSFNVYPNPAKDVIYIQSSLATFDIRVTNVMGEIIYESNNCRSMMQFNTDQFSKGIYFIELTNKQKTSRKKVIIKE